MCDILFASTKYRGNLTQHVGTLTDLHTFQYQEFNYKKALVKTHRVTPSACGCVAVGHGLASSGTSGVERDWTIHSRVSVPHRGAPDRTGDIHRTDTPPLTHDKAHLHSLQSIHTASPTMSTTQVSPLLTVTPPVAHRGEANYGIERLKTARVPHSRSRGRPRVPGTAIRLNTQGRWHPDPPSAQQTDGCPGPHPSVICERGCWHRLVWQALWPTVADSSRQ
jgi:hypothetical protein